MPIVMKPSTSEVLSLEELVAHCQDQVRFEDSDSILSLAPKLQAIQNNRTFLVQRINAELRDFANVQSGNLYSHQVFFLGNYDNFFIRANFWPGAHDHILAASGPRAFFYG